MDASDAVGCDEALLEVPQMTTTALTQGACSCVLCHRHLEVCGSGPHPSREGLPLRDALRLVELHSGRTQARERGSLSAGVGWSARPGDPAARG